MEFIKLLFEILNFLIQFDKNPIVLIILGFTLFMIGVIKSSKYRIASWARIVLIILGLFILILGILILLIQYNLLSIPILIEWFTIKNIVFVLGILLLIAIIFFFIDKNKYKILTKTIINNDEIHVNVTNTGNREICCMGRFINVKLKENGNYVKVQIKSDGVYWESVYSNFAVIPINDCGRINLAEIINDQPLLLGSNGEHTPLHQGEKFEFTIQLQVRANDYKKTLKRSKFLTVSIKVIRFFNNYSHNSCFKFGLDQAN